MVAVVLLEVVVVRVVALAGDTHTMREVSRAYGCQMYMIRSSALPKVLETLGSAGSLAVPSSDGCLNRASIRHGLRMAM